MFFFASSSLLLALPLPQTQKDSTSNQYFEAAESLYRDGEYEKSTYNYLKAAELNRSEESWNEYLKSINYAGINLRYLAKYKEALKILRNGLILGIKKLGENNLIIADLYNSLGSVFYDQGNLNDALPDYEKSLQICLNLFGEENKYTARGYHNVGLIYYWLGDADKALDYLNKALAIWIKTIGEKNTNVGNCYINLANTYFYMEDFETSLNYDLKALETWKAVLGEEHQYIAMSYNNLAQTYETIGKNKEALAYDKKALALRKKLFGDVHPDIGYSLAHIAKDYTATQLYDSAYYYYDKAFRIYKNYSPRFSYRLEGLLGIAKLNLLTGNLEEAMKNYDTILVYTSPDIFSQNYSMDSLDIRSSKIELLSAIAGKGDVYYKKYSAISHKKSDLEKAYAWYWKYGEILKKIKSGYKRETAKLLTGENLFSVESRLIETSLELYKLTGDKNYQIMAFQFAEESKAGTLIDAINESGAKRYSGIPDSLIKSENDIKKELAYVETKIQENEEAGVQVSEMVELIKRSSELNQQYEKLIDLFEQEYPKYYKLKYSQKVTSIEDIQNNLLTGTSLFIEYFITDSSLFIFTIDKNDLGVSHLNVQNLYGEIINFRNSLSNLEFGKYISSAQKLYSLLIKPVEEKLHNKKRLYIVPAGVLNYLPFEALISKSISLDNNPDFSKLHYLINDYEMCYNYSASLMLNNNTGETFGPFAGFAPVFPDKDKDKKKIDVFFNKSVSVSNRSVTRKDQTFSSLPESEKEVVEIGKLFGAAGYKSKTFTFASANELNLKSEEISKSGCLHLATHGFINDDRPKLSGLLLADDSLSGEDGILYSEEIFILNLNACLVVLSACESGLGKIKNGEGILGLTRGFLYAGASNVVVSLWQVADESTSELMIKFYRSLLTNKSIPTSLREAKLSLIKDGKYSYPLEWAPFILIGSN